MNENNYSVYIHTNKVNGKQYVGITCQKPERRWGKNGTGYEKQRKFWNAIQKYGWDGFTHEVLTTGLTKAEASTLEIELIADGNTIDNGYNVSPGGDLGNPSEVVCLDTGIHYASEVEAAASVGGNCQGISDACYNGTTYHGYHWQLVENINTAVENKNYGEGLHVVCVETGREFKCLREAADYYGISNPTSIKNALNDFEKAVGGKHWMLPLSTGIEDQAEENEEENDEKFSEEAEEAALEDYFNDYLQYACDEEWS